MVAAVRTRTSAPPSRRAVLTLTSAATLLALMNYTAPASTLAATADGLRAGPAAQVWLLSGISLGLVAALSPLGSLADSRGRKAVFGYGAALLALASLGCALAPGAGAFVAGRLAQGVASAALLATGLGIVGHSFPAGAPRARATGMWAAMLGAGIALGPLASAALAAVGGWRLWFWVAAVASAALAAAARALPESRAAAGRALDLPGALTLTFGVSALMVAVTLARAGWGSPAVAALLAASAALLGAFGWLESRRPAPMIEPALLRSRSFLVAAVGALFTGLAVIGFMSYLSTVLERALGMTPVGAALVFAVWSGTSFLVALRARRLPAAVRVRQQLALGLALSGAGELALAGVAAAPGPAGLGWAVVVPGLAVAGVGSGLANAALARLAVDTVPADRASMGSGANNTARYIGAGLGVAMVMTIAPPGGRGPAAAVALAHGAAAAAVVSAALALAAAAFAVLMPE